MTIPEGCTSASYDLVQEFINKCEGNSAIITSSHIDELVDKIVKYELMQMADEIKRLREALLQCIGSLQTYVHGGNPNSPYIGGKNNCYVLGSKEALEKAKQALSNGDK